MPRQLIKNPLANRDDTLGWLAVWWIETFVVHGPGDVQGEPIRHTDEYTGFLLDAYALGRNGRRLHDSAFLSRAKGCNKSGLAAEIALFEALGPCRFAGIAKGGETYEFLGHQYVYEKGEMMGKAVTYPYVRIMATEEEQTGNTYDMVYQNLDEGPLSALKGYGMRVLRTKIDLPFNGEIVPSTSGAASKDGGKETFVVFDETHLYNTPQLRAMYATVNRNLPKRARLAEPWALETTTMYAPGEESIAEETYDYAQVIEESTRELDAGEKRKMRAKRTRMLFDHRWGEVVDLDDEEKLEEAVLDAYGDAMNWNTVEGLVDKILDPRVHEQDTRRYYLNALTESHNAWLELPYLNAAAALGDSVGVCRENIAKGEKIALGFDGALTRDATALMGCRISDGAIFTIMIQERPDTELKKDPLTGKEVEWVVDQVAFDAKVAWAFEHFKVVSFFADPPHWQDYVDSWEREYGERLKVQASPSSAIRWWTKRDIPMSLALERLYQAIKLNQVPLDPYPTFIRHMRNARRWERRGGTVIGKDTPKSKKKIDAAMAATLAYEARAMYLAKAPVEKPTFVPRRIR